jgi:hypothetical protein
MNCLRRAAAVGVLLLVLLSHSVSAEPRMERLLVPIFLTSPVPGAFGSLWTTELLINNRSDTTLTMEGFESGCPLSVGCIGVFLEAQRSVYPMIHSESPLPARVLYIEEGHSGDLDAQLRIRDLSRATLTWGTEIPVIPESKALTGASGLLDIPVSPDFRLRLRLYAFSPEDEMAVRIRGYRVRTTARVPFGASLDELVLDFVTDIQRYDDSSGIAGYSEFDLSAIVLPSNVERLRLRFDPLDSEMKYWAFVSITNNETQHITVITPQLK